MYIYMDEELDVDLWHVYEALNQLGSKIKLDTSELYKKIIKTYLWL